MLGHNHLPPRYCIVQCKVSNALISLTCVLVTCPSGIQRVELFFRPRSVTTSHCDGSCYTGRDAALRTTALEPSATCTAANIIATIDNGHKALCPLSHVVLSSTAPAWARGGCSRRSSINYLAGRILLSSSLRAGRRARRALAQTRRG